MSRNTKLSALARLSVTALEDLKGQDIVVLDVQPLTTVTDTMVVCTGSSNRHVKSLAQSVVESAKENGHRPLGVEGTEQGEWVLVDLGGVVVHVMQAQARAFYQLEKLWALPEPSVEAVSKPKKPRTSTAGKKVAKAGAGSKSAGKAAKKAGKKAAPTRARSAAKGSGAKPAARSKPAGKSAKPAVRKPAAGKAPARKAVTKTAKKAAKKVVRKAPPRSRK